MKDIGIGERVAVPYWAPRESKEEGVWVVAVVNDPERRFFQGRYIIPLFDLPEEDQKLSPEKAFQKHLPRIMTELAIVLEKSPQILKGVYEKIDPAFLYNEGERLKMEKPLGPPYAKATEGQSRELTVFY